MNDLEYLKQTTERCMDIIESCVTEKQAEAAERYFRLQFDRYQDCFGDLISHKEFKAIRTKMYTTMYYIRSVWEVKMGRVVDPA